MTEKRTVPKEAKVLISNYSNKHLSANGDPPDLVFIYGTDEKNRQNETFVMRTSVILNKDVPELTATVSHCSNGLMYDVTARDEHRVVLEPRGLDTSDNDIRHQFVITQQQQDDVMYIRVESASYRGRFISCFDNGLQLNTFPEKKQNETPFYFSVSLMP